MKSSGLDNKVGVAYYQYDFAAEGGGIGAHAVEGDGIPAEAVIVGGGLRVNTAVTSAGAATVAITALTAADILAATGKADLTLDACLDIIPDNTGSTGVIATSAITSITFTVATAALTAGKITVWLEFVLSE